MNYKKLSFVLLLCILLIWANAFRITNFLFDFANFKDEIDPFSAINAMFSGLALIGVVLAIMIQQQDLSLQRKEMQATREVFEIERFEVTFFNLLNNHRQIVSQIQYEFVDALNVKEAGKWENKTFLTEQVQGVAFFQKVYHDLKMFYEMTHHLMRIDGIAYIYAKREYMFSSHRYKDLTPHWMKLQIEHRKQTASGINLEKEIVLLICKPVFAKYKEIFQYYFNNLIQSLLFIKDFNARIPAQKDPSFENKYINLLKSHLTPNEVALLYYYVNTNNKLKKMFMDSSFFDNLDTDVLLSGGHIEFLEKTSQ